MAAGDGDERASLSAHALWGCGDESVSLRRDLSQHLPAWPGKRKGREGKGREGKGREGKERGGKGREGKGEEKAREWKLKRQ